MSILKAQELLAKHKLSLKEVDEFKLIDNTIKENISSISFTKAKWKAKLARLIADNFGCCFYLVTNRSHAIAFFNPFPACHKCSIGVYATTC